MLSPSSIFSFETLRISLRPSPAILLAIGLSVVARLGLAFAAGQGLVWPTTMLSKTDTMREYQYREYGPTAPSVLLIGTSRFVDVQAACIAQALGVPRDAVANFSHLGNSVWRNLALLRRNPEMMQSAKVVYFDISPYQLNHEVYCDDPQFLRHATLSERVAVADRKQRTIAVVDALIPMWSERRTLLEWFDMIMFLSMPARLRADTLIGDVGDVKHLLWSQIGPNSNLDAIAEDIATTGPMTDLNLSTLDSLLEVLPKDCTVIIVHIPVHGRLAERFYGPPKRAAAWKELQTYLEKRAAQSSSPKLEVVWANSPEAYGLTSTDFLADDIHFNDSGNEALCQTVARHVRTYTDVAQ